MYGTVRKKYPQHGTKGFATALHAHNPFKMTPIYSRQARLGSFKRYSISVAGIFPMAVLTQQTAPIVPASANTAPGDPSGEWHRQANDYATTRYSTLSQINLISVKRLRIAWTFSEGAQNGHEGAPLAVNSSMDVVAPFPDVAYALDLSKPGSPLSGAMPLIPRRSPSPRRIAMPSFAARPTQTANSSITCWTITQSPWI
jgi:hypothetical protein